MADELFKTGLARLTLSEPGRRDIALMVDLAQTFFALDVQNKNATALPEQCGYRPMGIEYSVSPDRPDLIESFTYSPRVRGLFGDLKYGAAALGSVMERVFTLMCDLSRQTVLALAGRYGPPSRDLLDDPFLLWSRLQINFSRPAENADSPVHESHEDGDFFTVACASAPGLEIGVEDGVMIGGPVSFEEVVFMPGKILYLMTGGEIQPAYHRVVSHPEIRERIAVMFFADLDPRLCLPWQKNELNVRVDIGQVVAKSVERFGLKSFSNVDIGII